MKKHTMATLVRMIAGMYHTWVTQVYCNASVLSALYSSSFSSRTHHGCVGDLGRSQRPNILSHARSHHWSVSTSQCQGCSNNALKNSKMSMGREKICPVSRAIIDTC